MKHKHYILLFLFTFCAIAAFAQTDKEEKKEEQEEKKAANQDKVDFNVFRRQMLTLKEYIEERKKIPELQKENKATVKVLAVVDSLNDEDPKKLIGYIRQDIGDNSVNVYEVTYDRTVKKIISVKPTGETADDDKDETASDKKNTSKHAASKKKKKDDDDEDDDDTPPTKKKRKDDDD